MLYNSSTPGNFDLGGVEFGEINGTAGAFNGLACYGPSGRTPGFIAFFVDGSEYSFNTCSAIGTNPPLVVKLSTPFHPQDDPQVGVLIIPSTNQVYFLVGALQS